MTVRSGKGDKGFTDLLFKKRISKDSLDMRAIGNLDELNGHLGLIRSKVRAIKDKTILEKIQRGVSSIASEIAVGEKHKKKFGLLVRKNDADWIKGELKQLEKRIAPGDHFYLPGGNELAAFINIARAVARRTERSVVGLFHEGKIKNDNVLSYLNCISDVLFIMAVARAKRAIKRKGTRKKLDRM